MTTELVTLLAGCEIGRIARDKRGRLTFTYAEDWREASDAHPAFRSPRRLPPPNTAMR